MLNVDHHYAESSYEFDVHPSTNFVRHLRHEDRSTRAAAKADLLISA